MDIGSLLIILGIAVLAMAFVARPLVERQASSGRAEDRRLSTIQADLDRVMATIQELDMDFTMAKIEAAEYQAQRSTLLARGVGLMRERDGLQATAGADEGSLDARIEAEVARMRGVSGAPSGFCGKCGQPTLAGDRFCVRCGAALTAQETGA